MAEAPHMLASIRWRSWETRWFEQARREGRPIMLYLRTSWGHWCKMMERKTLTAPKICDIIRDRFIPIWVDADQRPDINDRYTVGGWPSMAVLSPEAHVIAGGSFFSAAELARLLTQTADTYARQSRDLDARLARLELSFTDEPPRLTSSEDIHIDSTAILRSCFEIIRSFIDLDTGRVGRQGEPVYAHPEVLDFLARYSKTASEPEAGKVARRAFDFVQASCLHDRTGGGFYRYADGAKPIPEKTLEVNAHLLSAFALAVQIFGDAAYGQTARGIAAFLRDRLWDSVEGAFAVADRNPRPSTEMDDCPDSIFTSGTNALTARALLYSGHALDNPALAAAGREALDGLLNGFLSGDGAVAHTLDPECLPGGYLFDHVEVLRALLTAVDLHEEERYALAAKSVRQCLRDHFEAEPEEGGFYDIRNTDGRIGRMRDRRKPFEENARLAGALSAYAGLFADETAMDAAEGILRLFTGSFQQYGLYAAHYGSATLVFAGNAANERLAIAPNLPESGG